MRECLLHMSRRDAVAALRSTPLKPRIYSRPTNGSRAVSSMAARIERSMMVARATSFLFRTQNSFLRS